MLKVIKWTNWDDFSDKTFLYTKEEEQAVIDALKETGYIFSGDYHQYGEYGVPYLSNNKRYQVTMRVWGRIMSQARPDVIQEILKTSTIDPKHIDSLFAWDRLHYEKYYKYPTKGE